MKTLLTIVLCLMSGYLLAQNPQILNKAQAQQRIQSINLNNSIKFAKAEFVKQGFKDQTGEDDSFQMIIEYTTKDGTKSQTEVDIQSMQKNDGDLAMVAHFKRGNTIVVETINWKANQPINSFKINKIVPIDGKIQMNEIKIKGGPSVDFSADNIVSEEMNYAFESVKSTNSVLAAFFGCLTSEVQKDCTTPCFTSIMSCINSKKGGFKNKIHSILGSSTGFWELVTDSPQLLSATVKFAGGVATCLVNSNCGSCAGTQVLQCFGAAF
jgi:hypothetical protein